MSIEQISVKYDSNNNFIVLKAIKKPSLDTMKQSVKLALEMREIENCENVLIDATKTIKLPSKWDLYLFGTFMTSRILKLMKMRFAFAISNEISKDFKFFDDVVTYRGVDVHTFKNVNDAKEWLLNK